MQLFISSLIVPMWSGFSSRKYYTYLVLGFTRFFLQLSYSCEIRIFAYPAVTVDFSRIKICVFFNPLSGWKLSLYSQICSIYIHKCTCTYNTYPDYCDSSKKCVGTCRIITISVVVIHSLIYVNTKWSKLTTKINVVTYVTEHVRRSDGIARNFRLDW